MSIRISSNSFSKKIFNKTTGFSDKQYEKNTNSFGGTGTSGSTFGMDPFGSGPFGGIDHFKINTNKPSISH